MIQSNIFRQHLGDDAESRALLGLFDGRDELFEVILVIVCLVSHHELDGGRKIWRSALSRRLQLFGGKFHFNF